MRNVARFKIFFCAVGIEREFKLFFPVEISSCDSHRVVEFTRARSFSRDIRSVRSNFISDNSFAHIFAVRQAEMLFRRNVTKHSGAGRCRGSSANRGSYVVISRRDVANDGPEQIKRRAHANFNLFFNVHFYLVERDMSRSFNHNLHVGIPTFLSEFSHRVKLGELRFIARVGEAAGAKPVTETQSYIVFLANF